MEIARSKCQGVDYEQIWQILIRMHRKIPVRCGRICDRFVYPKRCLATKGKIFNLNFRSGHTPEGSDCHNVVFQTTVGGGGVAALGEMAHGLSLVESGEGNDTSTTLCGAGSRRCWGL